MSRSGISSRWGRRLVLLVIVLGVLSGCSSSDEPSAPVETDASATASETTAASNASTGDFDCEALGAHAAVVRGAGGWGPQITDAELWEAIGGDLDVVDEAIEGLRPIQDIEGIFGTTREGLDNLAADVQAIRDGNYGDFVGSYNTSGISAVLGEEVCK